MEPEATRSKQPAPLTVLQVSEFYPPVIGGLERQVEGLAHALAGRGHRVVVAVPGNPHDSAVETFSGVDSNSVERTTGSIEVRRFAGLARPLLERISTDPGRVFHPTAPDPGLSWRLQALIDEIRPDIVHIHGWVAYSALAVRSFHHAKVVVTLHDHALVCANRIYIHAGRPCSGPQLSKCARCNAAEYGWAKSVGLAAGLRLCRPLHRRLDAVIAVSSAVADSAVPALSGSSALVRVIPGFVEPNRKPIQPDVDIDEGFSTPAEDFALFVGALGNHKGLDVLLEAFEQGFGGGLMVVGTPTATTPKKWPKGVEVATNVDHATVMELWRRCRVGVAPSISVEPFGLVAVEAMQAGKPVVASNIGGLRDIVDDGTTGYLVPPGDATALRDSLVRIFADSDLAERLGKAGQLRALRFETDPVVDRIEQLYDELLERRSLSQRLNRS